MELPVRLRSTLKPVPAGRIRAVLAAGQTVDEDAYYVDFPFDGQVLRALATFTSGDEILIGTRLLREHRLEVNFVEQSVLLERLGAD